MPDPPSPSPYRFLLTDWFSFGSIWANGTGPQLAQETTSVKADGGKHEGTAMNRIVLLTALLILALAGSIVALWRHPPIIQPIDFSHLKHSEAGLECETCHRFFQDSARAGRPVNEVCLACHETALTESREEEKLRQFAGQGIEVPWQRRHRLSGDIYFSHQRHVVFGGIECSVCHGDIGKSASPPARAAVKLTMDGCVGCHSTRGASTDCIACHR
jgi:menaquinone reductase, multiheme cytochrome c subunit